LPEAVATSLTLSVSAKSDPDTRIHEGDTVLCEGRLSDQATMNGVDGKDILLYDNDAFVGKAITSDGGNWVFQVDLHAMGDHLYFAVFEGDAIFASSISDPVAFYVKGKTTTLLALPKDAKMGGTVEAEAWLLHKEMPIPNLPLIVGVDGAEETRTTDSQGKVSFSFVTPHQGRTGSRPGSATTRNGRAAGSRPSSPTSVDAGLSRWVLGLSG
jgi:hypothetical protein